MSGLGPLCLVSLAAGEQDANKSPKRSSRAVITEEAMNLRLKMQLLRNTIAMSRMLQSMPR
jgi:hypothetical protein